MAIDVPEQAQQISVQLETLEKILEQEFVALKEQDMDAFDRLQPRKTAIMEMLSAEEVMESIKEEFGYKQNIKEVGAAPQYKKFVKSIDKERDKVGRETLKFVDLLRKKGLTDAADDLLDSYKNNIIKFGLEVKKIMRKII